MCHWTWIEIVLELTELRKKKTDITFSHTIYRIISPIKIRDHSQFNDVIFYVKNMLTDS